jgi:hypothetical protein
MDPYIQLTDLLGDLAQEFVDEALIDNPGDDPNTNWASDVYPSVQARLDAALLAVGIALPLIEPYPDAVINAAKRVAIAMLYSRRGYQGEQNPYEKLASTAIEELKEFARRQLKLADGGSDPLVSSNA